MHHVQPYMAHSSSWLADHRGQQWCVFECFGHLHYEFNHSTMNPNRRHSGCITTYFHRHHNCLWGDETRWMESPGREKTARSILGCRPVEGHHGPLLKPDGTWCTFSLSRLGELQHGRTLWWGDDYLAVCFTSSRPCFFSVCFSVLLFWLIVCGILVNFKVRRHWNQSLCDCSSLV